MSVKYVQITLSSGAGDLRDVAGYPCREVQVSRQRLSAKPKMSGFGSAPERAA